jgi:hypothetical protein
VLARSVERLPVGVDGSNLRSIRERFPFRAKIDESFLQPFGQRLLAEAQPFARVVQFLVGLAAFGVDLVLEGDRVSSTNLPTPCAKANWVSVSMFILKTP